MEPTITIALITSASSLLVAVISVVMNNRILGYKVDELKKQVEKHNQVVEKVAVIRQEVDQHNKLIEELHTDVEKLKTE